MPIDKKGLVGLSRNDKEFDEKSGGGFWVSFRKLEGMEKYVVVGEVVEGLDEFE